MAATKNEQLVEEYEDALFALLMNKVAESEGDRLWELNQKLQQDPSAAVPESVDQACRNALRKALNGETWANRKKGLLRVLNRVAVAAVIAVMLFATAYAAFPDVRIKTLNVLIQNSNVASRLNLVPEYEEFQSRESGEVLMGYALPFISHECVIVDRNEDSRGGFVVYENNSGASVYINITKTKDAYVDNTGNSNAVAVHIHGYEGTMTQRDTMVHITWYDDEHNNLIAVICDNLSKDFALSVAEGIEYIGE